MVEVEVSSVVSRMELLTSPEDCQGEKVSPGGYQMRNMSSVVLSNLTKSERVLRGH